MRYIKRFFGTIILLVALSSSIQNREISKLFIRDLKDYYLTVTEYLVLVIGLKHEKETSVKEYIEDCCKKSETDT